MSVCFIVTLMTDRVLLHTVVKQDSFHILYFFENEKIERLDEMR